MRATGTGIDIAAPPCRVWRLLPDFDGCQAWNPFLTRWGAAPSGGLPVEAPVRQQRRPALVLTPKMVALETRRELLWRLGYTRGAVLTRSRP